MSHIKKNTVGLFVVVAGALLLSLVMLELVVRVFFPQQLFSLRPDIWVPDDGLGWKMAANIDTNINTGEREVRLLTDGNGHRIGSDSLKTFSEVDLQILALGDSFLAALQVDYPQTMTEILAKKLSKELGANIAIENTGVWAWNPNHYRIKAKRELRRSKYDLGIVFLFMGNDVISERRYHYTQKTAVDPYLFRVPKVFSVTEFSESFFVPMNNFLLKSSHLFNFLKDRLSFILSRLNFYHRYFPKYLSIDAVFSKDWQLTSLICCEIKQLFEAQGIPVVFVLLPSIYQVDEKLLDDYVKANNSSASFYDPGQPSKLLVKEMAACGLYVVDATASLSKAFRLNPNGVFGKVDRHLDLGGHEIVADFLLPLVVDFINSRHLFLKKE